MYKTLFREETLWRSASAKILTSNREDEQRIAEAQEQVLRSPKRISEAHRRAGDGINGIA